MSGWRDFPGLDWSYDRDHLPFWFARPSPERIGQPTLFAPGPEALEAILAVLRISVDDLARWHERGWISFDLGLDDRIEDWYIDELRFVRDVLRSGLSDAQVDALLAELARPLCLDPARVAYSFSLGWVEAVLPMEPNPAEYMEAHLDEWLEALAEDDPEQLEVLQERINEILADLESAGDETGPASDAGGGAS